MSLKKQAEDLLVLALEIEKQAAEVTSFVCDKCKHTTTLVKINAARKQAANEVSDKVVVSDITVNDKVTCPAPDCQGVLSYHETEDSKSYYYDPDKVAAEPTKKEIEEEKRETPKEQAMEEKGEKLHEEPHTASVDYDAIDRYIKG
jgi:hypothetical protein